MRRVAASGDRGDRRQRQDKSNGKTQMGIDK
jgi:hypothetical protein